MPINVLKFELKYIKNHKEIIKPNDSVSQITDNGFFRCIKLVKHGEIIPFKGCLSFHTLFVLSFKPFPNNTL